MIQGIYHIYKPERHKKFFLTKQKPIPAKARMGNSPLKRISALAELRRATSGLQTVLGPKMTEHKNDKTECVMDDHAYLWLVSGT